MAPKRDHASESDSGRQGAADLSVRYPKIKPIQSIISAVKSGHQEDDVEPESPSARTLDTYKPPQFNTDDSEPESSVQKHERAIIAYQRMLSKHPDTLYGYLGLPNSASTSDVKTSYNKWAPKLHPNKNKLEDAKESYGKLQDAFLTLKDDKKRKQYDEGLRRVRSKSDQGLISESDSESDNESIPPPNTKVIKALTSIADDVVTCLMSDDQEARQTAKENIREANRKIQASNSKSGVKETAYTFRKKSPGLQVLAQDFRRVKSWLEAGNARLATDLGRAIIKNFDDLRKQPQNQWPPSWTESVTAKIAKAHKAKGHSFSVLLPKTKSAKVEDVFVSASGSDSESETNSFEDVAMTDVGQLLPQDERYWAIGPDSLTLQVKPGFTEGGRRILGYRAWYPANMWRKTTKFDPETAEPSRMQFIIQGYGRRIELVPSSSVGETAKYAYLDQDPSKKNFVPNRREEIHAKIPIPVKVKDYACCHHARKQRSALPDGVALCEALDGREFLISRAVLRVIMGKQDADTFIYVHLLRAGKTIPFDDAHMRQMLGLELGRPKYLEYQPCQRPQKRAQKRLEYVSSDSGGYDSSSDDYYGGKSKGRSDVGALIEGFQSRLQIGTG